jgi:hypothetical protein
VYAFLRPKKRGKKAVDYILEHQGTPAGVNAEEEAIPVSFSF